MQLKHGEVDMCQAKKGGHGITYSSWNQSSDTIKVVIVQIDGDVFYGLVWFAIS